MPRVLIVDDEPDLLDLMEITLTKMGLDTRCAASVADARRLLEEDRFDLCLTDMRLADGSGLDVLQYIGERHPAMPVAVVTAYGNTSNAVDALKAGAFDYLSKPVALDQLRTLVKTALKVPEKTGAAVESRLGELLGESAAMQEIRRQIDKLARTQAPVHISGESGSGKELAARRIHALGSRADRPFVPVNCGAIPESLMESEFFGYRKGAFTGAQADHEGFFQAASGGTLFLDEVADLPLAMQVKLLRAIQEKKVRRIGATQEEPVDVRIISATHQKLAQMVENGRFRQDLYYRLNVIELNMPSLRERPEDIPSLAQALLTRLSKGRAIRLDAEALSRLKRYAFPGNVRELENVIERALAMADGELIRADDLNLAPAPAFQPGENADAVPGNLQDYLDKVEREALLKALEQTRHNKTAAARLLGVTFRSLRYRLERLGIE
ncbi:sigma-54-dependent Fis family transcriptional regulator [Betaproteobacteria bacterium SCN2]|jgi:two-component system response regulator PilR (NtrC family)|nr:sigma-54-dependent Fis family transcriptional regulator [Betaproteobacteria bacterium SCN2]